MEITEVRIKLMEEPGERLKAFCSITFDNCFVVRDLKIIEGSNGPFVAMPSRKLTAHCPRCSTKNHLRAQHCNQCGATLSTDRMPVDHDGRAKLYADIAHPINSACREMIQESVIHDYKEEIERAKKPDYVSRYDDFDVDLAESRANGPTAKPTDTRIDQAHNKRSAHAPKPGGAAEQVRPKDSTPVPPPKSASNDPPVADSGFGAGILPEA